ncbi:MAG: histidine phosphatase family protein [Sphingomicrobium sp.]
MTTLGLMRHAKSSWDDAGQSDFDRPLNARGRAAAERMGRELKQRGIRFDHVLASPATRVRETLDRLALGYGALPEVQFDERIYAASEHMLVELIRALSASYAAALVVGHNPGMHQLLSALTGEVRDKFPTGAVAMIELDSPVKGRLEALILPRELD